MIHVSILWKGEILCSVCIMNLIKQIAHLTSWFIQEIIEFISKTVLHFTTFWAIVSTLHLFCWKIFTVSHWYVENVKSIQLLLHVLLTCQLVVIKPSWALLLIRSEGWTTKPIEEPIKASMLICYNSYQTLIVTLFSFS